MSRVCVLATTDLTNLRKALYYPTLATISHLFAKRHIAKGNKKRAVSLPAPPPLKQVVVLY